jgi:hypothetical protein
MSPDLPGFPPFFQSTSPVWSRILVTNSAIMLYRRDWYTGGYSVNRGHDAVELE